MTLETFEKVLSEQLNIEDKKPAFANGLYLSGVTYPYINVDTPTDISCVTKSWAGIISLFSLAENLYNNHFIDHFNF